MSTPKHERGLSVYLAAGIVATVLGLAGAPAARAEVEEIDCTALEHIKVGGTAMLMQCKSGLHRGRDSEGSGRPTGSALEMGSGFDITASAMFMVVRGESSHFSSFEAASLREFADNVFSDVRDWESTGREGSFDTAAVEARLGDSPEYHSCAVFLHQFGPSRGGAGYGNFFGGFLCGLKGELDPAKTKVFLKNVTY